jgi:hypothetical protein
LNQQKLETLLEDPEQTPEFLISIEKEIEFEQN